MDDEGPSQSQVEVGAVADTIRDPVVEVVVLIPPKRLRMIAMEAAVAAEGRVRDPVVPVDSQGRAGHDPAH